MNTYKRTPAKVLPLFYPLGRYERIKTVLMGTNTPHTCILGLVWQKQARQISQFELKSANSDFPFTLYVLARHYTTGGTQPPFFPLGEYGPFLRPGFDLWRDTSFDVPESSCLFSGPGLQLESRYTIDSAMRRRKESRLSPSSCRTLQCDQNSDKQQCNSNWIE